MWSTQMTTAIWWVGLPGLVLGMVSSPWPVSLGNASLCLPQILPDSEAFQDVQGKRHRGKHKFKVKEMYLTKLLSTKVHLLFWESFYGYLGGVWGVWLNFHWSVKKLQIPFAFQQSKMKVWIVNTSYPLLFLYKLHRYSTVQICTITSSIRDFTVFPVLLPAISLLFFRLTA